MTKGKKMSSDVIVLHREFPVLIEQDEDGVYVASAVGLDGCHAQAKTLDVLRTRIMEAVLLYLTCTEGKLKVGLEYRDG